MMNLFPNIKLKAASIVLLSVLMPVAHAERKLPVKQLSAGIYVIQAEVAASDADREQGLMLRTKMGINEGMVFDFGAPAGVCMWMKNTLIPLSVAFIDGEGKIVNIEDMQPETTDSHCAKKTVRYALEMNQGWFKQKNIKPGSKIEGLPLR
ncbi:DUF192 domain-containing protein [Undibacterium sp. CY21W]|nr:DUF192 domain-containing protein [Undibacterium sp. CY21W]